MLTEKILALGAYKAAEMNVSDIVFDARFRKLCESNACGNYGRNYMCAPDIGSIDVLIAEAKGFQKAIVYQTVGTLEDSYDFEGMMDAAQHQNNLAQSVSDAFADLPFLKTMHLGAGGCRMCERCAKITNEPCRHPERAMASLESYGIDVSQLAMSCDMKYIHAENTVTYFGAFFYTKKGELS